MQPKVKLLSVTSSRADVSPLGPIWSELGRDDDIELHVLLTGSHRQNKEDRQSATNLLPASAIVHDGGCDLGGGSADEVARAMGDILTATSNLIRQIEPDLMIVLGDRLDMLPAAIAALPYRLPVSHLHGGELTFGAIDDRIRHALTKLSDYHFVSTPDAASRVARMGEYPETIMVSGAPGLDAIRQAEPIEREALLTKLRLPELRSFLLLTVHPETDHPEPVTPCDAIIDAVNELDVPILITAANSDPAGHRINEKLRRLTRDRPDTVFVETLGLQLYANVLQQASAMVGNSSSGIIEAGLFGLPVINVGHRQDGRTRSLNVQDVPNDSVAIRTAIRAALTTKRYDNRTTTIYGDGKAAMRIAPKLRQLASTGQRKRGFFEKDAHFDAEWHGGLPTGGTISKAKPESSGALVTQSHIAKALHDLGVGQGDVMMLHCSLSKLGYVVGAERAIVEAALSTVGPTGSVVMPSFSGDLSDPAEWKYPPVPPEWIEQIESEIPGFQPDLTPSRGLGKVAEYFRTHPDTKRSTHPQSSFSASGCYADYILSPHDLSDRFGPQSPLARIEEHDGWIVLIGAPLNTCTILYLAQFSRHDNNRIVRRSPRHDEMGHNQWCEYSDIEYTDRWFAAGLEHLVHVGAARRTSLGTGSILSFRAAKGLSVYRRWLQDQE